VRRAKLLSVEPTVIPQRVDLDDLQLLVDRRRTGKMTGVWLSIADVESLITEARLYRNKFDAAWRRQQDAKRASKIAKERWSRPSSDD
jgi:hypothetical protein